MANVRRLRTHLLVRLEYCVTVLIVHLDTSQADVVQVTMRRVEVELENEANRKGHRVVLLEDL